MKNNNIYRGYLMTNVSTIERGVLEGGWLKDKMLQILPV